MTCPRSHRAHSLEGTLDPRVVVTTYLLPSFNRLPCPTVGPSPWRNLCELLEEIQRFSFQNRVCICVLCIRLCTRMLVPDEARGWIPLELGLREGDCEMPDVGAGN